MAASSLAHCISGIGAVSCVGIGAPALWEATLKEYSGIRDGLGTISEDATQELRASLKQSSTLEKPVLLAYASMVEAMRMAGWSQLNDDDGLILATTTGQIPIWENEAMHFLRGTSSAAKLTPKLRAQSLGSLRTELASLLGFRGRTLLVSSACSASTQALALASLWLSQRKVKRCLVGGVEALCNLTIEGFRSMQLLTTEATAPFDAHRKGINLSEGAAFICLETMSAKNSRALACLTGHGMSTDGYHMTAPHPEGSGSLLAMQSALRMARLQPSDISWVHAHGTGSKHNDQSEGAAIARLFEDNEPWVSSTKRIHGHALGASGALETVLCVKALEKQVVPRTSGLETPDPAIPLKKHPVANISMPIHHVLKNTLGFGGANAALVLSAPSRLA